MTGDKKVPGIVLIVSAFVWLACAVLAIWHVQNDGVAWAWFWGIISLAPMAVAYEIVRRWHRG